ncbi:DUF2905 domain-containing protein [Moraxella canis]|uniref:DUF2905 domain-containing protein n=1 Tax=Moraxella canis TaxID=90239 RepID=UPI0006690C98|nr:DUF2905 domain-containing protein [Moraxella canis]
MAKIFLLIGIVFVFIGIILSIFPNALSWFGKLPGDISYHSPSGQTRVYFPIVTMIIISVVLSIVLHIFRR